MNNQNDISKGHSIVLNDISKKTNEIIGLFKNPEQKTLMTTVKKFEKITAGIYLITDTMQEDLPLTQNLRAQALDALTQGFALAGNAPSITREHLTSWLVALDHVLGLVRIGMVAHHISPMNAEIIITEIDNVIQVITSEAQSLAYQEQQTLHAGMSRYQPLIQETLLEDELFAGVLKQSLSKRHQNDIKTTLVHQNDIKTTFQKDKENQNDISPKSQEKTKQKTIAINPVTRSEVLDRKQRIIDVIKSKQVATILDLKDRLPDISTKTLQRELGLLVDMNIITKQGNKRWTHYTMN